MPHHQATRWKSARLLWASALLMACASGPHRSAREDLRLDTETVASVRHAAALSARITTTTATRAAASEFIQRVPLLLTLLKSDNAVGELEERLAECARLAERQVNARFFGNRPPTREECGEEVEQDGCVKPITRAMQLGLQKHVLALQCAREVLEERWPAPFSIEQRYRYYPNAGILETISREQEARLIAQGCTRELWRTLKPDLVLHADRNLLKAALTLDFKFPCPASNEPRWTPYGEHSAYAGRKQGDLYKKALGGEAMLISPRKGVTP
ncbi:hypothetical protein [Corallococcus exercitus]|uniref:hypothetical protein n=1 Tax=Corallococcus exercitus TaxID=2316736 RepID=UPI0035D419AE